MVRGILFVLMLGFSLGSGRALGALGAQAISVYVNHYAATLPQQTPLPVHTAAMRRQLPPQHFQPILEANVFRALRRAVTQTATPTTLKDSGGGSATTLPALTLNGVSLLGEDFAFAFISTAGGRQQVYQHDHCVPTNKQPADGVCGRGQGKIVSIQRDSVVLLAQDRRITLQLKKPVGRSSTARHSSQSPSPRSRASSARKRAQGAGSGTPFPSERNGKNLKVLVPALEVRRAFENFSQILRQARVVPYSRGGVEGFQIRNIQPNSVFSKLHLQDFDILVAVNGQSVSTADQALQLFTAFRNDRRVNLSIRRGGNAINLDYDIQ